LRAAKADNNQPLIVDAFRKHGCTVAHTHMVGSGFPDIVVRCADRVALVEIKDGPRAKLTKPEQLFHEAWGGVAYIVRSVDDVAALVSGWRAGL
jgi:Holliday junction resolvase